MAADARAPLLRHLPQRRRIQDGLLREVPEQVQRVARAGRVARVGGAAHELPLLQLHRQQEQPLGQVRRPVPKGLLPARDHQRRAALPEDKQAPGPVAARHDGAELPGAARPRRLRARARPPLLQRLRPPHRGLQLRPEPGQAVDPAVHVEDARHPAQVHRPPHDQALADAADHRRGRA